MQTVAQTQAPMQPGCMPQPQPPPADPADQADCHRAQARPYRQPEHPKIRGGAVPHPTTQTPTPSQPCPLPRPQAATPIRVCTPCGICVGAAKECGGGRTSGCGLSVLWVVAVSLVGLPRLLRWRVPRRRTWEWCGAALAPLTVRVFHCSHVSRRRRLDASRGECGQAACCGWLSGCRSSPQRRPPDRLCKLCGAFR